MNILYGMHLGVNNVILPLCLPFIIIYQRLMLILFGALQWRHNEMASQITSLPIVYSTVYSFKRKSKKTSKLRVTGLCAWNSSVTGEFPAQMANNAE